jgi:hypothetical protein
MIKTTLRVLDKNDYEVITFLPKIPEKGEIIFIYINEMSTSCKVMKTYYVLNKENVLETILVNLLLNT